MRLIFGFLLTLGLAVGIYGFYPQDIAAQVGGSPLKVITNVPVGHCFAAAGPTSATDGGICASGTTGLTGMTANQVPIANSATTINSSFSLGTGVQTFLSAPSSANLATALTDETGSGAAVFGTSPTITTPTISGNLTTNITGLTQCVHANSSGVLSGTGVDCGTTGGGSGLSGMTATQIPIAATASTVTSSQTISQILDGIGSTQGGILYRGASVWSYLSPGTNGFFLETQGASANPVWAAATGTNGMSGLTTGQLGIAGSSNTLTSSVATGFTGSGTFVPQTTSGLLSPTVLPLATSSAFGGVKVDGQTIVANAGVIGTSAPNRTSAGSATVGAGDMGGQINFSSTGTATIPAISSTVFAAGMTVLLNNASSGNVVVSSTPTINGCTTPIPAGGWWALTSNGTSLDCFSAAASAATAANPTATIGTTAVNGSLSTYMRSDASPAIPQCSSSTFGACKVDGTTITASAGVITATGVSAGVASVASGSSDIAVAGTGSGPFTGAVTVSRSVPLRSQAGGSIGAADGGKIVYNTGGAGITLPVHTTTGFGAGFATTVLTDGTAATLTVTTDTLNGNSTLPLGIKQGVGIVGTGGSDYKALIGVPEVVASGVFVSSAGRVAGWQAGTTSQLVRGDGSLGTLGTAAAVATGTSGATIPLLNGNWTESGNVTFSGTILASGLSSGTCASGLAQDSGNNVVKISCPAGSGLSGMTTGQVGVAGGATSITSSVPFGLTGNSTLVETTSGGLITPSLIPATTLATGTSVSLTAPKQYYVCTGTCTVTPPVPAAGYEFCVMNDDNVATVITLAALGSSARYENTARTSYGTASTGTLVSTGAVGDEVCIVGRDSTHYLTLRSNGTWTVN